MPCRDRAVTWRENTAIQALINVTFPNILLLFVLLFPPLSPVIVPGGLFPLLAMLLNIEERPTTFQPSDSKLPTRSYLMQYEPPCFGPLVCLQDSLFDGHRLRKEGDMVWTHLCKGRECFGSFQVPQKRARDHSSFFQVSSASCSSSDTSKARVALLSHPKSSHRGQKKE